MIDIKPMMDDGPCMACGRTLDECGIHGKEYFCGDCVGTMDYNFICALNNFYKIVYEYEMKK